MSPARRPRAPRRASASAPRRSSAAAALERCVNVADLEALAKRRLPRAHYDFFAGGAEDERTIARNREAYDDWRFLPRALAGVAEPRLATSVLGLPVAMPILVAPSAYHRLAHPEGERATARAAGAEGVLMALSAVSTVSLEDVAAVATGPLWFQQYVYRDRALSARLVERAERAGYRAIVMTVDTPRLGRRERDARNGFQLPRGVSIANFVEEDSRHGNWKREGSMAAYANDRLDPGLGWDAVEWLRKLTKLPVVLKGIVRADDAARAVDAGASAVWVSNHGGRQLDSGEGTIAALPAVVDAVAGRAEVYLDGGIRRGTDALKALALGARAVFIGRPVLWGLAAGGETGVRRALAMLRGELENAMHNCGAPDATSVEGSLVVPAVSAGGRSPAP
jgi:4-hydroxymandelate oxidase